ncbi:exo-beta-N-acetylmuramidase NamZ domain-containing protein [Olleya sp. R77988]|uniref:exo-beta-N-acetylmuramidase NamZ family protein n=1 Tax=Olleya sp. R77988 TaxID=3093875 RepID=UPI0037C6236F
MRFNVFKNTVLLFVLVLISCASKTKNKNNDTATVLAKTETTIDNTKLKPIIVGANQTEAYLPFLKGQRVGIVANQTSVVFKKVISNKTKDIHYTHIVDSLVALQMDIKKVFAPEHGFRGTADAGEVVKDGNDVKTGLPIISLYGKNKKPTADQLKDIDVVIFDIQDVGARFYTYISSLHYVMEACAEQNKTLIVLDRPNPNGHYIDGPILETEHKSFIGMHPIPVVHGLTIGEYAQMINGEKWLKDKVQCNLKVITIKNYDRQITYNLPIKPSPNLPNAKAINLYPSLCFFEGTNVSAGRGTDLQFQIYGSPFLPKTDYTFTPQPNEGAKYPKHQNKTCNGFNLSNTKHLSSLNLSYLIKAYNTTENKADFFLKNGFFTKLAGTKTLQQQIVAGWSEDKIKATWTSGLNEFLVLREPYLLY